MHVLRVCGEFRAADVAEAVAVLSSAVVLMVDVHVVLVVRHGSVVGVVVGGVVVVERSAVVEAAVVDGVIHRAMSRRGMEGSVGRSWREVETAADERAGRSAGVGDSRSNSGRPSLNTRELLICTMQGAGVECRWRVTNVSSAAHRRKGVAIESSTPA